MKTEQPHRLAYLTVAMFALVTSCDKPDKMSNSRFDSDEILEVESCELKDDLGENVFPSTTYATDQIASTQNVTLLSDADLAEAFADVEAINAGVLLTEFKRRGTQFLASVLVENLEKSDLISSHSGEATYAPELRYPVASTVATFGKDAVTPLIEVIIDKEKPIIRRVLAMRTLLRIDSSFRDPSADFLRGSVGDNESVEFLTVLGKAVDQDGLALMFPFELERPMKD